MNDGTTLPNKPSPAEYQKLKEVLCELADLPAETREDAARVKLADDPPLLARILKMLAGLDDSQDFLEEQLPGMMGFEASDFSGQAIEDEARLPGASIGHFRILERLGEGGMAVVYRARQTEPIKREVALKVISSHATSVQRSRFERECSTLARFSHPNVAVMYESGVSPAGEPFVAMELIEGLPLTDWCRQNLVSIEQRISLFIEACQGLTHAHGKGILHRDIKPSNLLVTQLDGKPMVKVIDFGIAAALTPGIDQLANLTGQHLIGTPAYMSPESVHVSDRQALDARSDVYSLGVVLFELLCGKRPYDLHELPLADWLNTLATTDAPHMSQVFKRLPDDEQQAISLNRKTGPKRLRHALDSDLDAILGKALALEPERRYETSKDLGDDLTRYLAGKPVYAHPPSRAYLAKKFLRRHWMGAAATGMLIVMLTGGIVARELEVRQTRLALEESQAISDFLVDLLEHASPLRTSDEDVSLQDIIDHGTDELSDRFADKPAVKARLLHTLGRVYGERGDYLKGSTLMEQALSSLNKAGSSDLEGRIRLLSDLSVALRRQGRLDETETLLLEAQQLASEVKPPNPLLTADVANSLGNLYYTQEKWALAEVEHLRALELREANLPADDLQISASRNNVATALINSWQIERALPYAQRTFEDWQQNLPAGHPWIAVARNNLAIVLERLGRKAESYQLARDALDDAESRLGPDHPDVADLWRNISVVLVELGRRDEGRVAMQRHYSILANSLGPDAPRTLAAERRLVNMDIFDRDYEQALVKLASIRQRLLEAEKNSTALELADLDRANTLMHLGRYSEAVSILSELQPGSPSNSIRKARMLADLTGRSGNPAASIKELEAVQLQAQQALPERNLNHGMILNTLARQAIAAQQFNLAIEWASQALSFWKESHRTILGLQAQMLLGQACLEAGQRERGLSELQSAVAGLEAILPVQHPEFFEAEAILNTYQ